MLIFGDLEPLTWPQGLFWRSLGLLWILCDVFLAITGTLVLFQWHCMFMVT